MARPADPNAKIDLLQAAESVFVERGLDAAKVEEITGRARRGKGSFYLHFDSKEEAFRQIVDAMAARLACHIDATLVADSTEKVDGREWLLRWIDKVAQVFDFLWQNRGVVRLLLEGGRSATFGYLVDGFFDRARLRISDGIVDGIARGVFRADLDVALASWTLAGGYDRIARQLVSGAAPTGARPADRHHWVDAVQRLMLHGFVADRHRKVLDSRVSHKS